MGLSPDGVCAIWVGPRLVLITYVKLTGGGIGVHLPPQNYISFSQ